VESKFHRPRNRFTRDADAGRGIAVGSLPTRFASFPECQNAPLLRAASRYAVRTSADRRGLDGTRAVPRPKRINASASSVIMELTGVESSRSQRGSSMRIRTATMAAPTSPPNEPLGLGPVYTSRSAPSVRVMEGRSNWCGPRWTRTNYVRGARL